MEHIKRYHPLGGLTLFVLIIRRSLAFLLLVPFLFIVIPFINSVPREFRDTAINVVIGYVIFLVVMLGLSIFLGWLEYFRFWIFIDDRDLKIHRGLIATEQVGIPYRRIQDIRIKRSLFSQILGVSDIEISVLGAEDNPLTPEKEHIVILPALEKHIAIEIQNTVLQKAQVEQINLTGAKIQM